MGGQKRGQPEGGDNEANHMNRYVPLAEETNTIEHTEHDEGHPSANSREGGTSLHGKLSPTNERESALSPTFEQARTEHGAQGPTRDRGGTVHGKLNPTNDRESALSPTNERESTEHGAQRPNDVRGKARNQLGGNNSIKTKGDSKKVRERLEDELKRRREADQHELERVALGGISLDNLFKNFDPPRYLKSARTSDTEVNVKVRGTTSRPENRRGAKKAIEVYTSVAWTTAAMDQLGVSRETPVGPEYGTDMNDPRVHEPLDERIEEGAIGYYLASPECKLACPINRNLNMNAQQREEADISLEAAWKIPMRQGERVMQQGGAAVFENPAESTWFDTYEWKEYCARNNMHPVTFPMCGFIAKDLPKYLKYTTIWTNVDTRITSEFRKAYSKCTCGGRHTKLEGRDEYGNARTAAARLYPWKLCYTLARWARPYCTRQEGADSETRPTTNIRRAYTHEKGQSNTAIATVDTAADSSIVNSEHCKVNFVNGDIMQVSGYVDGETVRMNIGTVQSVMTSSDGTEYIGTFHDVAISDRYATIIDYFQLCDSNWTIDMKKGAERGGENMAFVTANTDVGFTTRRPTDADILALPHVDILRKRQRPWNKKEYLQNAVDIRNAGHRVRIRTITCTTIRNTTGRYSLDERPERHERHQDLQLQVDNIVRWTGNHDSHAETTSGKQEDDREEDQQRQSGPTNHIDERWVGRGAHK